ncbi:MAG: YkgJ family cysteine cluster protein [Desulfonatronovibrio sp.]
MDLGIDLNIYFKKYENLVQGVDQIFQKIKDDYPGQVKCDQGCTDCCFALFDLSLVEALYLNQKFSELDHDLKNLILIESDKADRKIHKVKKDLYKAHQGGAGEQEILDKASRVKVRCPLLKDNKCALYEYRPITCRLYGIPMDVGNMTATCSRSGFEPGKKYPGVHMNRIQEKLAAMSQEVATAVNSRYSELHAMLVPVSMCLLTDYTKEYLGVKDESQAPRENSTKEAATREWVLGPKE